MTPDGPAAIGPRRGVAWAVAFALVAMLVLWGWGAVTPGAVANVASPNGGAVLVSMGIDTLLNAGVVGLWVVAAYGIGYRAMTGSFSRYAGRRLGSGSASPRDRQAPPLSVPRPVPDEGTKLLTAVTAIALGIGLIGFATLALGLIGGLNRGTAWAIVVVGLAGVPWKTWNGDTIGRVFRTRDGTAVLAGAYALPIALLVLAASLPPGILWKPLDPHPYDVVSYHLQIPREWFEAGRIVALPHNSFSYFPAGQEVHDLLLMHLLGGPWAAMYACQLVSVALTLLTAAAVVGTVRALGGRPMLAHGAGLLTLCVPWTLMLGSVAYVESGVMLYSTLAVAWGMLALRPSDDFSAYDADHAAAEAADSSALRRAPTPEESAASAAAWGASSSHVRRLALAGVCAGFAGGIKYTALAMTAVPLLVLWPIVAWPTFRRGVFKPFGIAAIACLLTMTPWLVRNTVWTGNPVFPLATGLFGRGPFTADQVDRYTLAHEPPPAERSVVARVGNGWHRVAADPQFAYGLLPLAVLAIAASWRSKPARFGAAVLVATAAVWLLFTHDEPRFLAPAIPLAAILVAVAVAATQYRHAAWPAGFAMAVVSLFGIAWTGGVLLPSITTGRQGLFLLSDLTPFEPTGVKEARDNGQRLALIGDAQAFFYAMPPGRLRYRGVFDVNVPPGTSLADGWLGESIEKLRAEGYWVLIAPGELVRLSGSYAHLPAPLPPYDDSSGGPIVLPPTAGR